MQLCDFLYFTFKKSNMRAELTVNKFSTERGLLN